MLWQPKNVIEFATPIIKLWKYLGLPIYEVTGLRVTRQKSYFFPFAFLFLGVNISVYAVYYGVENSLRSWLSVCEFVAIQTQNVSFVLLAYWKRNQIPKFLAKCLATERRVSALSCTNFDFVGTGRQFLLLLIVKLLLVIFIFVIDCIFMARDFKDYIFRYCFYTGFVFYGASDFTILVLITPVEKLYGHFLNNLENHNLEESVRVFFMLQDLAQSTFNIIEEFMLAKILIDFFYASTDVFYGTASALEVQTSLLATVLSSFIVVLWLLFVVHSIVTISFVFGKVKEQHQVMNEIICERFRSKAAKNYRCEAKLLLRGKVNPLKFTICGFLPLDYCLAYTMTAGIVTYVIYLVQFSQVSHCVTCK
ncbi:uncharacterized protein LOC107399295 [Tribolium castaneum]|uniref:Gustatory receptor n=1 Tax=Tribolium castaneum TaxID=7070 RepID=B8PUN6_TRICA|nr:PREDICTED: uncharacterized protein LOC107399295 [Tribolium castaneum]ABY40607.1 gustatory receptor [Tribolium castaneum]EEZ99399.1 gustatory receptor 175 [Tribolium castaneum]|eukprot:XP_015840968.1 PREDICTED: uncharacterized protein LOC107399295 [Tribolium castaneum]